MKKKLTPSPLKTSFSENDFDGDELNCELDQRLIAIRQLIASDPFPEKPKLNKIPRKLKRASTFKDRLKRKTNAKIPQGVAENSGIEVELHKQRIEQELFAIEHELKELKKLYELKYNPKKTNTSAQLPPFEVAATSLLHNPVLRLWKRALIIRQFVIKLSNKECKELLQAAEGYAQTFPRWAEVSTIIKKIRQTRYNTAHNEMQRLQCALDWEDEEQVLFSLLHIKPDTKGDIHRLLELTSNIRYLSVMMRNMHIVTKISPYFWKMIFAHLAKIAPTATAADLAIIGDCARAGFFTKYINEAVGMDTFINANFLRNNPVIASLFLGEDVVLETVKRLSPTDVITLTLNLPEYRPQILRALSTFAEASTDSSAPDIEIAPTFTPARDSQGALQQPQAAVEFTNAEDSLTQKFSGMALK